MTLNPEGKMPITGGPLLLLLASLAASAAAAAPACEVAEIVGCYDDHAGPHDPQHSHRLLNHTAAFGKNPLGGHMSREECASLCCSQGFSATALFGVEFGAQCFWYVRIALEPLYRLITLQHT